MDDQCETSTPMSAGMMEGRRRDQRITAERRQELFKLAHDIASHVGQATRRHERCLLRQMVECLLED